MEKRYMSQERIQIFQSLENKSSEDNTVVC